MDRAEAIRHLESMATDLTGACVAAQSDKVSQYIERKIQAVDMAIAALREQEHRERGCEFCNERDVAVMSASLMTFDLVHKGCVCWYCPNCGRKLTEPPKEGAEG